MKAYTDIEQSKRLTEILPLESADMEYILEQWIDEKTHRHKEGYYEIHVVKVDDDDCPLQSITLPCWSLAALLGVLPSYIEDNIGMVYSLNMDKEYIEYSNPSISSLYSVYIHTCGNDNLVDACYEMIIKLHEQKLL